MTKFITLFAFIILSHHAFSQGDLSATLRGQNQTAKLTVGGIQVPNNLATKTGSIDALIEIGNTNILVNPSWEHSTTASGWTTSGGTYSQETSVLLAGKKSLKIVLSASTPVVTQDSTLYQAQFAGTQGLAYCRIKSDVTLTFATRNAGTTSTTNTVTVLNNNLWNLYKLPVVLGATSNGISIASASSQTGTVYIADCFLGAVDLKVDGAAITPWQSYTPTFTGFGTPTSVSFRWRQVGDSIQVEGTYVTGTVSATLASITLPNSYTIDANKISIGNNTTTAGQAVGQYRSTGANLFGHLVTATLSSTSLVYFADVISNASNSLIPSNGNASLVSSRSMSINFMVPISGLQGSAASYSAQCGLNCVDIFSAQGGITALISNENVNFINGDCTNANPAVCTFNTGIFTVSPNCVAIPNNANARVLTVTASSTAATIYQKDDTGAASRSEFTLLCQKQGADFVLSRTILGSFSEVMVAPGVSKPKTCYYAFGGASATLSSPTLCTTGTCVETYDSCGTGTPPTFGSTGNYNNLTFAAGTFANSSYIDCKSQAYAVSPGAYNSQVYFETGDQTWQTTSSGGLVTNIGSYNVLGTAVNSYVSVKCEGLAP